LRDLKGNAYEGESNNSVSWSIGTHLERPSSGW